MKTIRSKKNIIKAIIEKISSYQTVVFTAHSNPDGDAISSSYGLASAFKEAFPEKEILVVGNYEKINEQFFFLKLQKKFFIDPQTVLTKPYLVVLGDTSVAHRVNGLELFKNATETICFDHHDSSANLEFTLFWSEPTYGASSMQAIEIAFGILSKLSSKTALHLIFGVYTDTGFFKYSLAHPLPLQLVAQCLKFISNDELSKVFTAMSLKSKFDLEIMKKVYKKVKYKNDLAYVIFKDKSSSNLGKYVNLIGNIESMTKWAFFTLDFKDGKRIYKTHLRSNDRSLIPLVTNYGGGGHDRAAGCILRSKELKKFIKELAIL